MYIKTTHSTNTLLKELIAKGEWKEGRWPKGDEYLYTGFQTAGRGQTGNGWESEADQNLLCSIVLSPRKNLFELNVIASVAVHRLMIHVYGLLVNDDDVTIKWPNDIYWKDKKVAGILIENAIVGNEVKYTIAGIGININQTRWISDAPNPISWKQISGEEYEIDAVMNVLLDEFHETEAMSHEELWDYYKVHLYRKEGFWRFVERPVSIEPTMNASSQEPIADSFMARIKDILPTGEIVLQDQEGKERKYHFKQIRYVL